MRATGGPVAEVARAASPVELAVHAGFVYWTEDGGPIRTIESGSLLRAPIGGEPTLLARDLLQPSGIAADDRFAYFTSVVTMGTRWQDGTVSSRGGGIAQVPLAGGPVQTVDAEGTPAKILIRGDSLYWLLEYPPRARGRSPAGTTAALPGPTSPARFMTADADALYVSTEGNTVERLPLRGGSAITLAADLEWLGSLAVDGDWVYVAEPGRERILRLAKACSSNRPSGPIAGPCPEPAGTPEEVRATPRSDLAAEQLALRLQPESVTADPALYRRVLRDLAAIRSQAPVLADISHRGRDDGRTLMLRLTSIAAQSIDRNEYRENDTGTAPDWFTDICGLTERGD